MKKLLFAIVTTLFLTIFISTNHASAATTLQFGKTESGVFTKTDETITYDLILPSDGLLKIEGTATSFHTEFKLRNEDGYEISRISDFLNAEEDHPVKDSNAIYLNAGKYTVDAENSFLYDSKRNYQLKATFVSSNTNEVEPNDSTEYANKIQLNKGKYIGQLGVDDESDYYKINLPKPGYLALNTISNFDGISYEILDRNFKKVNSIDVNVFGASSVSKEFGAYYEKGDYYIHINRKLGYYGVYSFRPTFKAVSINEKEPNNGKDQAQLIKANVQKIKGLISKNEIKDVFKVKVTKSGTMSVDATVYPYWTNITIYNSHYEEEANELFADNGNGNSESKRFSTAVKPGTYYIEVENKRESGLYNFSVKVPQMLPKAPTVSKVTPKSKAVKGTTYKNSTVKVKIGSKIYTTKSSNKGKFSVKIPAQKAKKAIYVSVTTPAGTSASKKVIVK